jgi:uncharacterized protein (TIGR03437 family)
VKRAVRLAGLASIVWAGALRAQSPTITSVTGAGSPRLCPGGRAFIQGTNLGGNGATVTVGTQRAYVRSSNGGTVLDVQIPVEAPLGATTLKVGASAPFNITLVQYAPGVLTDGLPDNLASAFHSPSGTPVTPAFPATPNEQIAVNVNGLGPTNPVVPTGTPAPNDASAVTTVMPSINVAGNPATVLTAFLSPNNIGIYTVLFTMRADATTGNQTINVGIGGITSGTAILPVATGPVISAVTNGASYNDPSLPNGGIAQGAVAVIKGINLGPATISVASNAFQSTTLSGTSVSITVKGTTVAGLMYYTSATQVAVLLPSNTPVGTGTITVTYNDQAGPASPITVVANNLGILTITSDGAGAGIVTYPDYGLVSTSKAANCGGPNTFCGAANPGDTLTLWATGLGPVTGNDAAGAGLGQNMPNIPLMVWLGGVQAPVIYQGRSGCCVGLDQIVFTVPNKVPTGCAVPLLVQINNQISNGVAIPVASGSRTCTPTNPGLSTATALLSTTSSVRLGTLELKRQDNNPGFQDVARVQFFGLSVLPAYQPFFLSYVDTSSLGTCQVYNNLNNGFNAPLTDTGGLDAGSPLSVKGAGGTQNVVGAGGQYRGTLSANGSFLAPGTFTVSLPGGADIPAFSASITIPALATMTSPPPDNNNSFVVNRSSGLTVTWTGGSSGGYVLLDGGSATDNTYNTGASFECVVPASAGTFTVPPSVLLAMPAGNFGGLDFFPTVNPVTFSATGLDLAFVSAQYDYFAALNFK